MAKKVNLIAIVGPTASGKTKLSLDIADYTNGEIIAADSRTVYKGLDIGTAKPTKNEQNQVPHWGIDLVGPGGEFSVADFKKYATTKIGEIRQRRKLPIVVGGTGLYIDSLLYDFSLAPPNIALRHNMESLGVLDLQKQIQRLGLNMPENKQNKRYLIRTLERGKNTLDKKPLPDSTIIIGLSPSHEKLESSIRFRAKQMLKDGVMDEVLWGLKNYGEDSAAMTGGIYRIFRDIPSGKFTKEQATELFIKSDLHLAKRQITWFKRNKDINWFENPNDAFAWLKRNFIGKLQ